ncbi:MAG: histidine kinase [Candidatus Eisenbacteria bacterium]|uniref:Histidine kinase n=1 Tax=Eiseniibacteriota bacterium TaxID=2212470 RepID=A0A9D6L6J2_UNCEI|nr:histidine kinase [Candidatus Eisenbacteria bacterium]MBI3538774.1 histidine kinase [Candidatus Eisenbacteria bacterium]
MTHEFRARRALAVVAVAVALSFAAPRFLTHTPYPRLGVSLTIDAARGLPKVARVLGPPAEGLLRDGDVLISVNGERMRAPSLRPSAPHDRLPRDVFTLEFERDGRVMRVLMPPVHLSPWQRLRALLVPLTAVVAAPLVAFWLVWRRPDIGTAWTFLLFANLQAVAVVHEVYRTPDFEPTGLFKSYLALYGWLVCFAPASFIHFMSVFPRPRWRPGAMARSPWFWLIVAGYVTPLYFIARLIADGSLPQQPFAVYQTLAMALGVVSIVERYGRPGRGDWHPTRSQRGLALGVALFLLIGAALGWALENEAFAALLQFSGFRLIAAAVSFTLLGTPFVMAFLIARDPVFDPRRLLERGLPYALLSGVLAALYLGIVVAGQRLFASITGEQALVINVVAALVVAFVFAPLRVRLQRALDRLFRRDVMALRAALDQAGRELLRALDRDDARASVEAALLRGIGRRVALDWPENGPPRLAAGEELPEHAQGAVENLLNQAGIRLENLALQEQRGAAERRAVELREAATRAELRALHAQIQPHFLFNALNALSYLTETDPRAAQRFTERLADMLRYTVEAGGRSAALLGDEIAFVEDYLGIARERYDGELAFQFRGARELLSVTVPPLLLQPLVENSLKHGLAPDAEALHLSLDACRRDGWLELTFSDDGTANGNGSRGLGVGLDNLEQRVQRFAGPGSSMSAGPRPEGGFAVTMRWRDQGAEVKR